MTILVHLQCVNPLGSTGVEFTECRTNHGSAVAMFGCCCCCCRSKDNIKLQVLSNTLTISGERNEESREEGDKDKPARYERRFGSFSRSFTLPKNVDVDGITANAKDGVLTVTIPKVEAEKPKAKEIPVA
jgi:hypothetical protein